MTLNSDVYDSLAHRLQTQAVIHSDALNHYLHRLSGWTSNKEFNSLLMANGSPFEISIVAQDASVRLTVDPTFGSKMQSAYILNVTKDIAINSSCLWKRLDWERFNSNQWWCNNRWGCWHGLRFTKANDIDYKLYLEVNKYNQAIYQDLFPEQLFALALKPVMLGLTALKYSFEFEWYYALSNPSPTKIKWFFKQWNLASAFEPMWAFISQYYPFPIHNRSPTDFVGIGISGWPKTSQNQDCSITLFFPLAALWGSEKSINQSILSLLPSAAQDRYTAILGEYGELQDIGNTRFGMLGLKYTANNQQLTWYISFAPKGVI